MSKVEDGFYLMYVREGIMYPVALTHAQADTLPVALKLLSAGDKIRVMVSEPLGEAVNLLDGLAQRKVQTRAGESATGDAEGRASTGARKKAR